MTTSLTISTADRANADPGFSGSPNGVQRYQLGSSSNEGPAAQPAQGPTATDYSKVTRTSTADIGAGSGIEARSPTGRPLAPSEIKPDSLVSIQGQEMKVSLAERLGLLVRDANGYRSGAAAAPTGTQQPAQENASGTQETAEGDGAPALSEAAAASLETLNAGGGDSIKAATEFFDQGNLSEGTIARLAGRLGVEPDAVMDHVSNVAQGFRAQAAAIVGGEDILDLARHLDPALAQRTARQHALQGDTSGYAAMAQKATDHVIAHAGSVESTDSDVRVRTVAGKHLVSGSGIPGEITLQQAVRMGLVEVTVQR